MRGTRETTDGTFGRGVSVRELSISARSSNNRDVGLLAHETGTSVGRRMS